MTKLVLDVTTSGINIAKINENFQKISDEFQNKVLYRDNSSGEPNSISSDVDMNSRKIFNASDIRTAELTLDGVAVGASIAQTLADTTAQKDIAVTKAVEASSSAVSAAASATAAQTSGSAIALTAALAASSGAGLVGRIATGAGAVAQTVQSKLREIYSSADAGASGNNLDDDGPELNTAFSESPDGVHILDGDFIIDTTVSVPAYKELRGRGYYTRIRAKAAPAITTMFRCNSDGATWPVPFPSEMSSKVSNCFVIAETAGAAGHKMTAFEFAGSHHFHDIHMGGVQTMFKQLDLYCDMVRIERTGIYQQPTIDEYAIDLGYTGDGVVINQFLAYRTYDPGNPTASRRVRGIRLRYKAGAVISNILNGDIFIDTCDCVDMHSLHMEDGIVTFENSSGTLRNAIFFMRADGLGELSSTPLVASYGASATINPGFLEWSNCLFVYEQGFSGGGYTITKPNFELKSSPSVYSGVIKIQNLSRSVKMEQGDSGFGGRFGVNCGAAEFDNYSHFASSESTYDFNTWMIHGNLTDLPATSNVLNAASAATIDRVWMGANGTYYYKAQVLYDKMRLLGVSGGVEKAIAVTNGGNAPTLILETDVRFKCMVRMYRGTSSGSYDYYVDVPVIAAVRFADSGNDIAGYPWIARAAGPMTSINAFSPTTYELVPGDRAATSDAYGQVTAHVRGNATIPTAGAWRQGDRVLLRSPIDDGAGGRLFMGWHRRTNCTIAAPAHADIVDWAEIWESYRDPIGSNTQFTDVTSGLNTIGKFAGKTIPDNTTKKTLTTYGSSAASVWYDATGTLVYTPV